MRYLLLVFLCSCGINTTYNNCVNQYLDAVYTETPPVHFVCHSSPSFPLCLQAVVQEQDSYILNCIRKEIGD